MLERIFLEFGGTAVAICATAWLVRSIITHLLSKDVETFKVQLKAESDVSLERLRSDLQILAARRNVEYSRFHEKRLEIISELAGKLDAFYQAVSDYVSVVEPLGCTPRAERRIVAADTFKEFNKYLRPRRLFLPEDTLGSIDAFTDRLYKLSVDFMYYIEQNRPSPRGGDSEHDTWMEAYNYTVKEAPEVIKTLRNDFRRILGVEDNAS